MMAAMTTTMTLLRIVVLVGLLHLHPVTRQRKDRTQKNKIQLIANDYSKIIMTRTKTQTMMMKTRTKKIEREIWVGSVLHYWLYYSSW